MNKTLRWTLIVVGIVVAAAALLWGGMLIGRSNMGVTGYGPNMMGYYPNQTGSTQAPYGFGPGMMGNGTLGSGMMGYTQNYSGTLPFGPGMMGNGMLGGGIMGGGMMNGGMMGSGVMGGSGNRLYGVSPVSLDQARQAAEDYAAGLGNADLAIGEVMIFDNHAYAQIIEKSTGIGAQEVLVDPVTLAVYPEYGPNMMWNQKYSAMGGLGGMMGGGMTLAPALRSGASAGVGGTPATSVSGSMPVSAEEAIQTAQRYLDTYLSGAKADANADPFYGYYTIDIERDGKPVGMLSVNGYTRQVFIHTWHADFIEMSEE